MAQCYDIPPDTSEKEKAIGGILTFAQFGWLMGGFVIAILVFLGLNSILGKTPAIICAIPFLFTGAPFAFYTKYEMSLLKYIIEKNKFKKKNKRLINKKNI